MPGRFLLCRSLLDEFEFPHGFVHFASSFCVLLPFVTRVLGCFDFFTFRVFPGCTPESAGRFRALGWCMGSSLVNRAQFPFLFSRALLTQVWPSSSPRGGVFLPTEFDVIAFDEIVHQVVLALVIGFGSFSSVLCVFGPATPCVRLLGSLSSVMLYD